jgi:hypothetical protein
MVVFNSRGPLQQTGAFIKSGSILNKNPDIDHVLASILGGIVVKLNI